MNNYWTGWKDKSWQVGAPTHVIMANLSHVIKIFELKVDRIGKSGLCLRSFSEILSATFREYQGASFLEKISKIYFDLWWRHTRLIIYDVMVFWNSQQWIKHYMTQIMWRHQYEISRDESHYTQKTGTELVSFLEKKIQKTFVRWTYTDRCVDSYQSIRNQFLIIVKNLF